MANFITSIEVHSINGREGAGLKGALFVRRYTGCDLFVGPNGTGKTTEGIIAPVAAIEGLANVATDSRRPFLDGLCRDTGVSVKVLVDGEHEQTLFRPLDVAKGNALVAANADAAKLIGQLPTAWDFSDFASSTSEKRGKLLDTVAKAGGAIESWDTPKAQAHVRTLLSVAPATPDGEWTIDAHNDAAHKYIVGAITTAATGSDWLSAALFTADKYQTDKNTAQKEAAGYVKRLGETCPPKVDGDEAADSARRLELLSEQIRINASADDRMKAEAALARHEAEGERLQANLSGIEAEGKRLKVPENAPVQNAAVLADLEARVAQAQAALDAPVPAWEGPNFAKLEAAVAVAQSELDGAQADLVVKIDALNEAQTANDTARATQENASTAHTDILVMLRSARARVETLEGLFQDDATCVHCGAADPLGLGAQLATARDEVSRLEPDDAVSLQNVAAARHAKEIAYQAMQQAQREATTAANLVTAQERILATAKKAIDDATASQSGHVEQVRAQQKQALDRASYDLQREKDNHTSAVAAHTKREAQREADYQNARTRYVAALNAYKAWQAVPAPVVPDAPDATRTEAITAELATLDARIGARAARKAHLDRITEAQTAYETAKATWDASRALVAAIRQARDDMAAAAYRPIESAARDLIAGSGILTPYFAGPDEYGAEIPGKGRVSYHALSESEQRITAAAFVYALAVVSKQPCRLVLLDGIDVVQRSHRRPLIEALAWARSNGLVDNVNMTMAIDADEDISYLDDIPGLTIHRKTAADVQPVVAPAPISSPATDTVSDEIPF